MSEPRIHTVDWVRERLTAGDPCWIVHKVDSDGGGASHIFPKETVEWRAAEYGLTDIDEILDVILHEPYLPDAPDQDDAAARAGLVTSTRPDAQPVTLFNAASTADARNALRLRIQDAKAARVQVRPPGKGKDPLDVIRRRGVALDGVRPKREVVDTHRWQLVYGDLPVPVLFSPDPEVSRA